MGTREGTEKRKEGRGLGLERGLWLGLGGGGLRVGLSGEVSEGSVCLGHAVGVFFFLKSGTGAIISVYDFCFEAFGVGHTVSGTGGLN